ncbi:hypothetical protein SteCoe_29240 [Stentor coeruleus]|uniref:Aminoglycoside phosphotransferase domain-containing protein n=1 Tax=Stentor coeruleus TaxID=5963 RepID=A0A1R2B6G4_9CILI|nr:hypothetical protein SteCoe_29240 [Stentor coeruleus]
MEEINFVLPVVQKIEGSWNKVTEQNCILTRLVGNSSRVYSLSTSLPITPKRFIFRVFGSAETLDLNANSAIFRRLAENKVAPKIYVETHSYRIEEFLEGTRNLRREEFAHRPIAIKISEKLKEFHSLNLSDLLESSIPVCIRNALKWKKLAEARLDEITETNRFEELQRAKVALSPNFYDMYTDILPKESPIVLAHMDTSFLNILYREEKQEICLIDYDYTGYCYRGFDIAMLLQDIKYDYNYPVYPFYQYTPEVYPGDEVLAMYVKAYGEGVDMFIECKRCMIASHYLWAMWSFSLYDGDQKSMDMLGYGLLRFREFLEGYEEFKNQSIEGMRRQVANYFYD